MKKIISFLILINIVKLAAFAQQDPNFSNYNLLNNVTNASYAGSTETINVLFLNRNSMVGAASEGTPVTSVFAAEGAFGSSKRHGLGVALISDAIGFNDNVSVDLSYAHHRTFKFGTMGFGASIGMFNYALTGDWYYGKDIDGGSDPAIPEGEVSEMLLDVGFGCYLKRRNYKIGASLRHANKARVIYSSSGESEAAEREIYYLAPHLYIHGLYNIELPDPLFKVQASTQIVTEFSALLVDINANCVYNDKYWVGAGLRFGGSTVLTAATLGVGVELINDLNLGYMFDLNTAMLRGGWSSHEISISYSFNFGNTKNQKQRSVRFL